MKIFFSVGEPSGYLHGANLIRELRRQRPECEFVGYGGPRMAAAGCQLHEDLTQFAVMWFAAVILNLHKFIGLMRRADRYFREERPDAVVLIDYPGFNWWIAARAKARGIPVFYYGTPQMWAWAGWRVKKMRRYVDHVLCKLPFEVPWFHQRHCNATYVGHPYFDEMANQELDARFIAELLLRGGRMVTILPGSRTAEVLLNLPAFLQAARIVQHEVPSAQFAIASYNEKQADIAREQVTAAGLSIDVFVGRTPELIHAADCCLACSGSVSLELLHHQKPTVIHYRIGPFLAVLRWALLKTRYITLVNMLASDNIFSRRGETYDPDAPGAEEVPFPEYLTRHDKAEPMAAHIVRWLTNEPERRRRIAQLARLRARYGHPGASLRAAEYIVTALAADTAPRRACA